METVIHEDYIVEAMDMVETFCDTLLARFSMIEHLPTLGEDLAEAVFSLIWAAPRLASEIKELEVISTFLISKYGTQCATVAKEGAVNSPVNTMLKLKLGVAAPPKALVERYLLGETSSKQCLPNFCSFFVFFLEIATIFSVPYQPDEVILGEDNRYRPNNKGSGSISSTQKPLMGFEELQKDLDPLSFEFSLLPPLIPIASKMPNLESTHSAKPSDNENVSTKTPNISDFDVSLLPSVPNSSIFEDLKNVHPQAPPSGENDEDYFESIKRRFSALKKKHT